MSLGNFRRFMSCLAWGALLLVGLVVFSGCGETDTNMGQVRGRVIYRGQPVSNVTVAFIKEGAPLYSFGITNDQGEFEISTEFPDDGAYVGVNKITVSQPVMEEDGGAVLVPTGEQYFQILEQAHRPEANPLPRRYNEVLTTDLVVEVKQGQNEFELDLKPDRT